MRNVMIQENQNDWRGKEFTEVINSIVIIFHDSQSFLRELKIFYALTASTVRGERINKQLKKFFKVILGDLQIESNHLDDEFFLHLFNAVI